jgi:pimeloyl-ACP methyl ester carboxylesterase
MSSVPLVARREEVVGDATAPTSMTGERAGGEYAQPPESRESAMTSMASEVVGPDEGEVVEVGEVRLDAHLDGPEHGEVVLLISGLSRQRIEWPAALPAALHAAGLRTLTVDNRDVGRSTKLEDAPGDGPPYLLADMAGDHAGVLDHFGVEQAHVVGISMGGMIAQQLAIAHPERLRSLTSVMSTTGARTAGQPTEEAMAVLLRPAPTDREAYIERTVESAHVIGSPGLVDDDAVRRRAAAAFDRAFHPRGVLRQMQAIMASGDRTEGLAGVAVPTLVIHGSEDPLVTLSGGEATAEAIPGARLHVIEGMGHDLPLPLLPEIVGALVAHTRDASADR